ncbi:LysR family transcriptional regulator [Ensifer aridi]|uniref:LysR family transcriptional regulator n=1 Tax=Ensifer aridi TaxID=1708715 RepID=UPI000A0F7F03|nr:LysR family transcriptional regulator [Ensifer aridi]
MENFGGLKIFVRVASDLSFVEAGRQLGLSASAIGKAIARLEERLGVRLLHRTTHSVSLTAEGTLFLDRARHILSEIELAIQELSEAAQKIRGPMKVSLPTWAMSFMPIFQRFMQIYPEVRLELELTDRLVDIVGEGYDLAIRTGEVRDSSLMTRVVARFRHTIVASPSYLAAHGIPTFPEDLLNHRCLHRRHPESGLIDVWPLAKDGNNLELDLPVAAVANSVEARIELAEHGAGIACVPSIAVSRHIEVGSLLSVLEKNVRDAGVLRLLWPAGAVPSRNVSVLVDFVAKASVSQKF